MLSSDIKLSIASSQQLNNGSAMPRLGLGVFAAGAGTENAVRWALEAGYRHVDTAAVYRNEAAVGAALRDAERDGVVARSDVFVATKLWNADHGYDAALRAFDASLSRLGLAYVDLYLIHWPVERLRRDSWRALESLLRDGRTRAIGVSNYTTRHLEELMGEATVVPAVNQVELHPFLPQPELVRFCRAYGIAVEAYSPLGKGRVLDDPRLARIAASVGCSPAQVMLRWSLQSGFVAIPKSVDKARIGENARLFDFELDAEQMRALEGLAESRRTAWDPTDVP